MKFGPVAQLYRAAASEAAGQKLESSRGHQYKAKHAQDLQNLERAFFTPEFALVTHLLTQATRFRLIWPPSTEPQSGKANSLGLAILNRFPVGSEA